MRTGQWETPERRGVGAQLVGDQQFRREALLFEQLAHQPVHRDVAGQDYRFVVRSVSQRRRAQRPAQGADLESEIPLSTKVPRHTVAISSSLPASFPGRSTKAIRRSSARLPTRTGFSTSSRLLKSGANSA